MFRKATSLIIIIAIFFSLGFIPSESLPTVRPKKDYALFFAVNQYDNPKLRPLVHPINDAKKIAAELKANYGFETEVVENPDLETIELKLEKYKDKFARNPGGAYQSEGQLLVFLSGHGMVEFENGFFLPKDANPDRLSRTALAYEYWRQYINSFDCKHILVAIDACFSGTFDPSWYQRTGGRFGRPGELPEGEKLLLAHEKYTTRVFFTSATEIETPDRSNFAKKFIDGLLSKGGADGILTYSELFTYLEMASPKPHYGEFGDDEPGSSFLLVSNTVKQSTQKEEDKLNLESEAWIAAFTVHNEKAYQDFLNKFPDGKFGDLARLALQRLNVEKNIADAEALRKNVIEPSPPSPVADKPLPSPEENVPEKGSVTGSESADYLMTAKRALGTYSLDPNGRISELGIAQTNIDLALGGSNTADQASAWLTRGEIYNEIASKIIITSQSKLSSKGIPEVENPAVIASYSFQKAYELARKKYETKDALKGLKATQLNLSSMGIYEYGKQAFLNSFLNFNEVLVVHEVLKKAGETSSLDLSSDYDDQLYITGLAAIGANQYQEAKPIFQKLYNKGNPKPAIYEAMYKIETAEGNPGAYRYLEEGRKKYPEDVSLLFAEINHYLKANQLDVLIGKLKQAIQKEPNNASLYSTLGNVYDNLMQKEFTAGNETKAKEYMDLALNNYQIAIQKRRDYSDALYSIGALHYNMAAHKTLELNELSDDFSKEGIKKYDAVLKEINSLFDQALPYFQQVEKLDPNDINTLIALKEIYARKGNMQLSKEFKNRMERVQNGQVNTSYFK